MTMTATQKADRLALIAEIGNRRNKMAKLKKASAKQVRTVNAMPAPKKRQEIEVPDDTNIYQCTHSSKYAAEYYVETLHYTTNFDHDWD